MWRAFLLVLIMVMGCADESKADAGSDGAGDGASSHDHADILERLDALEADLALKTAELEAVTEALDTQADELQEANIALAVLESELSARVDDNAAGILALQETDSTVVWGDLDVDLQDRFIQVEADILTNTAVISTGDDNLVDRVEYMEGLNYVTESELVGLRYATADDLEEAEVVIAANETRSLTNEANITANTAAIDSLSDAVDSMTSSVDLAELDARVTILEAVDYVDESAWMDVVELLGSLEETIAINTAGIVENMAGIETNAVGIEASGLVIASNTSAIATTDESVAGNTVTIDANTAAIGTNGASILTNSADVGVNTSNIASNTADISANTSEIAAQATAVAAAEDAVASVEADVASLEADVVPDLGDYLSVDVFADEVVFSGANVLIQSGSGYTCDNTTDDYGGDGSGSLTGLGNLIVGYNEGSYAAEDRAGSHNLVLGTYHQYTAYSSLVTGENNDVHAPYAATIGGTSNRIYADNSVISGGYSNYTGSDATYGGAFGSYYGEVAGYMSSLHGGNTNRVEGFASTVTGGRNNYVTADGSSASISGGFENTVGGGHGSISGGSYNTVSSGTNYGSILGGAMHGISVGNNRTVYWE